VRRVDGEKERKRERERERERNKKREGKRKEQGKTYHLLRLRERECVVRRRQAHATKRNDTRAFTSNTRVEREKEEESGLSSSTWLARERAVLGAPQSEAEGESERDREKGTRERETRGDPSASARKKQEDGGRGSRSPFSFSLSPPRSLFNPARWATPPKEGQRSILGPRRVVTSSYATTEYEVTHARSSTIR